MLRTHRYVISCIPSAVLLLACGAQDPEDTGENEIGTSEDAILVPGSPPLAATTSSTLPGLPEGVPNNPAGSFTRAPIGSATTVPVDAAWNAQVFGDQFSSPPATPTTLANAAFLGGSALSSYWSDNLWTSSIQQWIDAKAPSSFPAKTDPVPTTFGFAPQRVRWLRRQNTGSGTTPITPIPKVFTELQQRGARLFCAATTAFQNAGARPVLMGKRALASVKVLGKRIDIGAVEPTITMASPQKIDTGTNDGTEAFVIPMAGGVRVTPFSLVKSFPELRAPVVLIASDTDTVARGSVSGSTFQEWETLTHAVAFGSGDQILVAKDSPEVPMAIIGPITISAQASAQLAITSCAQSDPAGGGTMNKCRTTPNGPVKRVLGGTILNGVFSARPSTFPAPRKGNWTDPGNPNPGDGSFNDDAWVTNLTTAMISDATTAAPNFLGPGGTTTTPMGVRALMDDDKSMELRTGITAHVTLKGTVGPPLPGPISFGFTASGSMTVDGAVVHSFREEEEVRLRAVQDPDHEFTTMVPDPVTALTVTPSLDANFTFATTGTLFMTLHLALFDVSISKDLWKPKPTSVTVGTGRWPEKERLRIGTAHEVSGTLASDAQSHWPGGTNFASFPTSISSCLGPTPAVTALSTPCGPITTPPGPGGTTTAVQGNLCVYYPANWDTDPDLADDVRICKTRMSGYAQSSVTLRQTSPAGLDFAGQLVDAHPIKMTSSVADTSDRQILAAAAGTCATAYGTAAKVASEIHVAPCDATGKLFANWIDGTQPAVDNTPKQSSIETPGTCP